MNVTIDRQNDYVLATVSGSIDTLTLDEFRKKTQPLIEQSDSDLLIEMTELQYLNSDALARIVELNNAAKQEDNTVVLISPPPLVRKVLNSTRLDTLMPVVDSLDAALAARQCIAKS